MAYDEELADRVRELLGAEEGLSEKRMFGGLAFLINGNMAVSASAQGGLLLRVDPAQPDALVRTPRAERFRMRGREMDGWLRIDIAGIDAAGIGSDDELAVWVAHGVRYARSLPPKRPSRHESP